LTWCFNALHNIGFSSTALVRGKSRNWPPLTKNNNKAIVVSEVPSFVRE
jgi:hypothetical protein